MAKVRQLFNAVSVEVAQRRRICHHNRRKHSIAAGDRCLVVKDPATGGGKNYCHGCAIDILDRAQADLDELRHQLS
jgi:hypothetical protein